LGTNTPVIDGPVINGHVSRLKAPFDLFEIRVPSDVAKLASRFSHEAVAALRLEIHTKSGKARTYAAHQLLALALHAPDAAPVEQVETLTDEMLDQRISEMFRGDDIEEWLADYGYLKARTESERAKVRAIVNRPRRRVA
jgi:hypothetical protein